MTELAYPFVMQRIPFYILSEEWKGDGYGGIAYHFHSGLPLDEHLARVAKEVEQLLKEHEDNYTSWIQTSEVTNDLRLFIVTVVCFRVRDAY